jgi:hypothetical protein
MLLAFAVVFIGMGIKFGDSSGSFLMWYFLAMGSGSGVAAWWFLRTRTYEYKNMTGLRYLNTLHGARWNWGKGHERITKHIKSLGKIDPKSMNVEKAGDQLNLQDIESFGISCFVEQLRQGSERIDTAALSEAQQSDLAFDFQVLGTEFQRQAEKVKRITEDSALATQYQQIALYCQKEAKRMEQGGLVSIANEVTAASATLPQGQVEELKNIGGSVRLVQQEGRVTELRFYGLPPGEYTVTMKRQTKVIRIEGGAVSVSLAELGVSPQPHGAFMIDAPNGETDAVQW